MGSNSSKGSTGSKGIILLRYQVLNYWNSVRTLPVEPVEPLEPLELVLDCCLVDQHHRDVVLDRVDAVAGAALQRLAIFHQRDGSLARWTGKDFEQFSINWHP